MSLWASPIATTSCGWSPRSPQATASATPLSAPAAVMARLRLPVLENDCVKRTFEAHSSESCSRMAVITLEPWTSAIRGGTSPGVGEMAHLAHHRRQRPLGCDAIHLDQHVAIERDPGQAARLVADLVQRPGERHRQPHVEQVLAVGQPPDLGTRAGDHRTADAERRSDLLRQLVPPRGRHDQLPPGVDRSADCGLVARDSPSRPATARCRRDRSRAPAAPWRGA